MAAHSLVTSEIFTLKRNEFEIKKKKLFRGIDNDTGVHTVNFLHMQADEDHFLW